MIWYFFYRPSSSYRISDVVYSTVCLGKAKLWSVLKYPDFAENLCVLRSKAYKHACQRTASETFRIKSYAPSKMRIMAGGWVQGWMLWRRWVDVNEDEEGQARSGLISRWVNVSEDEEGEARLGLWRRWVNVNEDEEVKVVSTWSWMVKKVSGRQRRRRKSS